MKVKQFKTLVGASCSHSSSSVEQISGVNLWLILNNVQLTILVLLAFGNMFTMFHSITELWICEVIRQLKIVKISLVSTFPFNSSTVKHTTESKLYRWVNNVQFESCIVQLLNKCANNVTFLTFNYSMYSFTCSPKSENYQCLHHCGNITCSMERLQ